MRDGSGMHHLLWEVVSNSLDEHLAGRATRIRVSVEGQLAEVEDDGGGISLAPDRHGVPFMERALTELHCGATLDGHLPHVHVGPTGLGLAVVNALSERLDVEVRRDGWSWHRSFVRGVPVGALERRERTERTGMRLRFRADASIFGPSTFDRAAIRSRLVELAAFNPGLTFDLMAEPIREPRGIAALLDAGSDDTVADVFTTRAVERDVLVEAAVGWCSCGTTRIRSLVGQSDTEDGGSHERGFVQGLARAIAAQPGCVDSLPRRVYGVRRRLPGLHAIVHVDRRSPVFGGPTRSRLACPEVQAVVREHVERAYGAHLRAHPDGARRVLARLSSSRT
ncbi:MAG: hypothetical protein JST00_42170 [Deltaproteobacteria bacterium]|nr:hypothetical protein [Deltaproteobacteria bacterium]